MAETIGSLQHKDRQHSRILKRKKAEKKALADKERHDNTILKRMKLEMKALDGKEM